MRAGKAKETGRIQYRRPVMKSSSRILMLAISAPIFLLSARTISSSMQSASTSPSQTATSKPINNAAGSNGAKKLVLKDGGYQLVREYQRNGDRVRYFSAERGDWEEIPAAMVDWDATAKAETAAAASASALLKQVHHEQEERQVEAPMDVDASLPIAPGIFLPGGEGMFVVEGKSVTPLDQAGAEIHADKKQTLKQILSPVPIVPSKKNIELPGAKAARRINSERPEFYLREPPPDPDRVSPILTSGQPGDTGPEVALVKLTVKGGKRQIESIRSMFGQQVPGELNAISIQRWDIAKDVYRFTLSQELPAGEYAFTQILQDGINLYVWDFGVDRKSAEAPRKN